jgi:hypothetical protein
LWRQVYRIAFKGESHPHEIARNPLILRRPFT